MVRKISVDTQQFPIAGTFTISRGSKTSADVLVCSIEDSGKIGRGECVPYARYSETLDVVRDTIEAARVVIEGGGSREDLLGLMPAGAARNAVDCALWDLEARLGGTSVAAMLGIPAPQPLETCYTLSLAEPDQMEASARAQAHRPILKVKVGTDNDEPRIRAVARGAPASRIILDANEGWTEANIVRNLEIAAQCSVVLVEQPLPAGKDGLLARIEHLVPICADESLHLASDLGQIVGLYDAVNIKLDKTGGLTEAIMLRDRARGLGLGIMVGCMVGSSLAMAPAVLLAQGADFVDLDGPLLLAKDRDNGLRYNGSLVFPPDPALWG
ncbi:MAG: N-acetyl-D-Glu racemase DgcA [Mesorhizobium sp.]